MYSKKYDKPVVQNTAPLMHSLHSESDAIAGKYRQKILSFPDHFPDTKQVWYLSSNGDDTASGSSPEEAWCTVAAFDTHEIHSGDAVLFERGGVYRGHFRAVSGVFYGAYGKGDKPCLYGSAQNYANADWQLVEKNLWSIDCPHTEDIGIIVLNHGEKVGFKQKTADALAKNDDFYYQDQKVLYYSEENPSDRFYSMEMGDLNHLILMMPETHDVIVENLCFKYGGSMAIQMLDGVKNIAIRGCEIGWIGGCYLPNFGDGKVRYGNGIENWNGCDGILVENCWIYQIYDSGLSHQGHGTFVEKNITYRRNLIEYTSFASIEYWTNDASKNAMENITYSDNVLRFSGYGWGDIERPSVVAYHILSTGKMDHLCKNFTITGNVMDLSTRGLIKCTSKVGTLPQIHGNTYIQKKGGLLGGYGNVDSPITDFNDCAAETLKTVFHDEAAVVKYI